MKKCVPIIFVIFAVLFTACALTGCAGQNSSPVYKKLIAYKTADYGQQSVADFNAALASTPDELTEFLSAEADVISTLSHDDENYDFFATTITFSAHELYCAHKGEKLVLYAYLSKESGLCDYLDDEGNPVYDFSCFVDLQVPYFIDSPELVSVSERDRILLTFKEEMQNYLNGLSEAEIVDGNIKTMLVDQSAELAKDLSTENMKLSPCEIPLVNIIGGESAVDQ